MNKIVSLITARGGSKGIPNKNIIKINGKPLIWYSINASLHSNVSETWVSTDSKKIANISEKENHHPSIMLEWDKVTVRWWTHKIKGLHENDFIMSAKTDEIYNSI